MNYLEIVLTGFFNHREALTDFYYAEFKKVEKEGIEPNLFFNGCLKTVKRFKANRDEQINRRREQLNSMLIAAKEGTLKHEDNSRTVEQLNKETIELCKQEIKELKQENYFVNLSLLTNGRVNHNMGYFELLEVEKAIILSFQKAEKEKFKHIFSTTLQNVDSVNNNLFPEIIAFYINEAYSDPKIAEYNEHSIASLIIRLSDMITTQLRKGETEQRLNEAKDIIIKTIHIAENTTSGFIKAAYRNHKADILERLEIIEKQLNRSLQPQQIIKGKPELNENGLSEKIKKHFNFFQKNCPRKHKQILKEEDFNKLIQWTIQYFENDFKVPKISEPIKVVNTNKTFVQLAFKYLFKELHKSSPYPNTLFEFYRNAFKPFSEDKKSNFEAVKNKDEVKKLMLLDY